MKRDFLILTLLVFMPLSVQAERYTIDREHSRIGFKVHHLLGTARGEFRMFSGTIDLDAAQPERSSVMVKIEVASIDTEIQKRDRHLLSAEFFDAKQFPEITFRSRSAKRTGPQSGDVVGDLSMHGVSRPMTLHVQLVTSWSEGNIPARTRWVVKTDPISRKDFRLLFSSTAEMVSGIGQEVNGMMKSKPSAASRGFLRKGGPPAGVTSERPWT
jgi:polyisoprenoid-binding protein YceI